MVIECVSYQKNVIVDTGGTSQGRLNVTIRVMEQGMTKPQTDPYKVSAHPTERFFVFMLTKDIELPEPSMTCR